MTIERKLVKTSGATSSEVYVEDVFQTHLYTGNGSTQTITNGIDLSTKGGLVWLKSRSAAVSHTLYDTVRGAQKYLISNEPGAQDTISGVTAFNTTGFNVGSFSGGNGSAENIASWTFRKQPKFFDIVTYTGNGTSNRQITHALGSAPGMIIVKTTGGQGDWWVWHRSLGDEGSGSNNLILNSADIKFNYNAFATAINQTSTYFTTGSQATSRCNASGVTYVAYLFAHDAGGFGAAGTDSVVSCGSYTGNGSATGPLVTLGWEPQYILVKNASSTGGWNIFDNMRGISTGSADPYLFANTSAAEATTNGDLIDLTATGFQIKSTNAQVNTSGNDYVFIAIRRGPMKTPTDATKVFAPIASTTTEGTTQTTGFAIDSQWSGVRNGTPLAVNVSDRLRGISTTATSSGLYIRTYDTAVEATVAANTRNFSNTGFQTSGYYDAYPVIYWNFRRAPGFFDVVCYTGTASTRTVAHNLGVAPELMIVKARNTAGTNWNVFSRLTASTYSYNTLQTNSSGTSGKTYGPGGSPNFEELSSQPTSSVINIASSAEANASGRTYVAYLFATCPGVSKVGSYTGNGSSQTINCGFASGARFVLIKRTGSTGDWYVWDTARGIVSGDDPHLSLNSTAAEVTTNDTIDPASSGFIVNQVAATNVNVSGGSFIFLAVA